jgi:hypothetical protein
MVVVRFRQIYMEAGKLVFIVVSVTADRCYCGRETPFPFLFFRVTTYIIN